MKREKNTSARSDVKMGLSLTPLAYEYDSEDDARGVERTNGECVQKRTFFSINHSKT